MSLIPWRKKETSENPLVALRDEMNQLFDNFWHGGLLPDAFTGRGFPRVEMTETDDTVVIRAELPGMEPKDIDLSISGDVLTLKGERKEEKEEKEKESYYKEVRYGSFSRTIRLPESVDTEKVKTDYEKGVLKVTLEKKPETKAKKIEVKAEKEKK
jgi:HSP20 family protein